MALPLAIAHTGEDSVVCGISCNCVLLLHVHTHFLQSQSVEVRGIDGTSVMLNKKTGAVK